MVSPYVTVPLQNLISIKHGFAFESQFFSSDPSDYILLTPGNFHRNQYLYFSDNTKYYNGEVPSEYVLDNGDLVVVMTDLTKEMNILGNSAIVQSEKNVLHNQRIGKVGIVKPDLIEKSFLLYVMNSNIVRKHIKRTASGSTVRHTSPKRILEISIPLPSLAEQRKIARILHTADKAIRLIEELIMAKQRRKQVLIQWLLTGKVRFSEFEDEWETKQLQELGKVIRGASPRPKGDPRYYGGDVPRLMVEDVTRDGKFVTPRVDFLTIEGASKSRPCEKGTLTVVCSGTVGIPSFLTVDACIHDGFLAIVDLNRDLVDDNFLYYQIFHLKALLERSATHGGVFTNLTTTILKEFEVQLPKVAEQRRIAAVLDACDEEIDLLQQKLAAFRQQKQSLMQQLLTGKIRVKV